MRQRGVLYALSAYVLWGLSPLYWKFLTALPPDQIIAHRIWWSWVLLALWGLVVGRRWWVRWREPRVRGVYGLAAVLLAANWLTYIWAVQNEHLVEASLGYFINPLVSVLLGLLFLRERLRVGQWLAVGLATVGVTYLTWNYGRVPWVAFVLAGSFGLYGLLTKIAPLDALEALTLETGFLAGPALAYLLWHEVQGQGLVAHGFAPGLWGLVLATGPVTATPLALFGLAARQVPLSVVGLLQYLAPTLQFLLGVLLYQEPFTRADAWGYGAVWVALLVLWGEGVWAARRAWQQRRAAATAQPSPGPVDAPSP